MHNFLRKGKEIRVVLNWYAHQVSFACTANPFEGVLWPSSPDAFSTLADGMVFTAEPFRDNRGDLREIADAMSLPVSVCGRDFR
jgi:hypothetical protein